MEKVKNWAIVILWMEIIFSLSSIPGEKISFNYSNILSYFAHFLEFFILSFLLYRAILKSKEHFSISKTLILTFIISISYASLDEFHQYFVPGRFPSLIDVGVDSLGIFTAGYLVWKKKLPERLFV